MANAKRSPLAPERFPDMPRVRGVRLATWACGVRYHGRDDVLLVELAEGTSVGGVFTRSATRAAPVRWCQDVVREGRARALLVNAGNANVFTGAYGDQALGRSVRATASLFACPDREVLMASTGVIGERLPDEKITTVLADLKAGLRPDAWEAAARAIMTTDTFPKGSSRAATLGDMTVTINGIAKGSGMIAPDMATMLAFVFTDALIAAPVLQTMLSDAVERTFNSITVDSDTSTSDSLMLFATGACGNALIADPDDERLSDFRSQLEAVCLDLAHQVVRDGEGASKFVTITVTGAEDDGAAKRIALCVANSPLVKTAVAGEDANWGRIVMAVGKAGERAERDRLAITIGGVPVAEAGAAVADYDEAPVAAHMKRREVEIAIDMGLGLGRATVWTCDLTHAYIDINGAYRS